MKQKIINSKKDSEKYRKALTKVDQVIELSKNSMLLKYEMGLGFWMRQHAVKGTDFKRLKKDEKEKLFDEYTRWYQGAFGKLYRPSGTWLKSRNISEFVLRMDHEMPKILELIKTE